MVNIDLLDKTLNHIKTNPDSWNQSEWRCGSSFCFAGHAALLDGAILAQPEHEDAAWRLCGYKSAEDFAATYMNQKTGLEAANRPIRNRSEEVILTTGETGIISDYARDALGIDQATADALFESYNSLEDLERMVKMIKEDGSLDAWEKEDEECTGCTCCCEAPWSADHSC